MEENRLGSWVATTRKRRVLILRYPRTAGGEVRPVHLDAYAASRDGVLDELVADGTYSLCIDRPARFVLGSLPDVTVWPVDVDLKVMCEGFSGPRPRMAQLTELQLPRLGMESSAGAHVTATKNKVYNHDRAYSAEDELDMFEDYCRTIAWGASQHAKDGGERRTCKSAAPRHIYIYLPLSSLSWFLVPGLGRGHADRLHIYLFPDWEVFIFAKSSVLSTSRLVAPRGVRPLERRVH